jgi:VWFA-related protein
MVESGKMFTFPRLLALSLTVALLMGQQPAPVFRAGTKLVELTVTVLDKKGNAVAGLEPADFTILDEGKARPVTLFRFDGVPPAPATPSTSAPLPPGIFSNRYERPGEETPRNITALVLDTLNTPPQQSTVARAQMFRYLRTLAPQSRVALFLMGTQLRILHDFTDDPEALRARLEKATLAMPMASVTNYSESIIEAEAFVNMFAGDPAMQKAAEDMARNMLEVEGMANAQSRRLRMERSLAAMEALGQHLAGIPGRKNMVWIGSGFSMLSITGAMGMGIHGSVDDFEVKVRQTSQRLAQQGIVLYIVDSKGIEVPYDQTSAARMPLPPRGRGRFEPQMDSEAASNDPRPAMDLMASITGGRYLHNTNDLTAGFKQTAIDMQGSYTLGFYMPGEPDDKWHKLKIHVKRSGVTVRHREGYLASFGPEQPPAWTAENWRAAFSNPLASTVIPLAAKCQRTASGELALTLVAEASAVQFRTEGENRIAELEVAIGDRTADGSSRTIRNTFSTIVPAAKWEEASKRGITYTRQWKPADDVTSLRVILHDVRGGQYGTLDIPLNRLPQ